VKLLPDVARVVLLSDGARASRRTWIGQSSPVTAGTNSEIVFGREDVAVDASTAEQLARRTLWREGMLAFDDTPLSEAVADVTRQSGVRFTFADPALADLRVGGLVRADDLDAFLTLLNNNLAVRSERRDGEIVLSSTATL
jgi:transmembrane sensor